LTLPQAIAIARFSGVTVEEIFQRVRG